jgi:hypothetical protein
VGQWDTIKEKMVWESLERDSGSPFAQWERNLGLGKIRGVEKGIWS